MQKNKKRKLESQSTNIISQQIKPANMIHASNLKNALSFWPRLNTLDKRFLSETDMIMAIRTGKHNIYKDVFILVKKNGNVYSYDGDKDMSFKNRDLFVCPQRIEHLCNKDIKTFIQQHTYGLYMLTNKGEVYTFNDNRFNPMGQEANYIFRIFPNSSLDVGALRGVNIVDIVCGQNHTVALSVNGKVYTWGKVMIYLAKTKIEHCSFHWPTLVAELENKKVICIACGKSYSIVVTDTGEVYSWGILFIFDDTSKRQHSNKNDVNLQMNGISRNLSDYRRIYFLATIKIVKVACGSNHVLALTDKGDLYVWGQNNHGQLGTGNKTNIRDPVLLNTSKMGKLSDIAAISMKHISVAVNENGCFYVWGQYDNCEILTPRAFPHHMNMYDVFAPEHVMYKPLILSASEEWNVMRCLKDAFDDPSTSDFKVQVEGRAIHVHKAVLKIRSSHFKTMFQHEWTENTENILKLSEFSYNVYKAYLKYLYTDVIDISSEELELLKLADMYGEINLKTDCILLIQRMITVSNVALFYSKAIEYDEKRLKEYCFSFILHNMTKMILTKNFMKLDEKTRTMCLIKAAKLRIFKT